MTAQLIAEIEEYLQNTATEKLPLDILHKLKKTPPVVALLPANTAQLTELSQKRKLEFLSHLSTIFDSVEENNPTAKRIYAEALDPSIPKDEANLLGNACATCMGSCCRLGKTHAFIDYPSLQKFINSQPPEFSKHHLLDQYNEYFPEQSYQHSCVFHAEEGCALPNELRSFNCNNFLCENLQNYRQNIKHSSSSVTFAATVHNDKLMFTSVYSKDEFIKIKEG